MEPDLSRHWTYFIEFFLLPPVALALVVFALQLTSGWTVAVGFGIGLVIWTLLEYWIHRIALHHIEYFAAQHNVHHRFPKMYIGVSTLGVFSAYLVMWTVLAFVFSLAVACSLVAGVMISYLVYISIHHHLHHGDRSKFGPWMTKLWNHHASHHRGGEYNYGVSTTIWDHLFSTMRPRG